MSARRSPAPTARLTPSTARRPSNAFETFERLSAKAGESVILFVLTLFSFRWVLTFVYLSFAYDRSLKIPLFGKEGQAKFFLTYPRITSQNQISPNYLFQRGTNVDATLYSQLQHRLSTLSVTPLATPRFAPSPSPARC